MKHRARQFVVALALLCGVGVWTMTTVAGQAGATGGEWPTYGGDLGSTRYSPLNQINGDNFGKLEVAWRFKTDSLGPLPEFDPGAGMTFQAYDRYFLGRPKVDIVHVRILMKDRGQREAINKPWLEMFPDEHSRPARHALETNLGGQFIFQAEIVAVLNS